MLDKLCRIIGKEWMVLGLELGIKIEHLEQIEYCPIKRLPEITRDMLYYWRNRDYDATIKELLDALSKSRRNQVLLKDILEECVNYPNIIPDD